MKQRQHIIAHGVPNISYFLTFNKLDKAQKTLLVDEVKLTDGARISARRLREYQQGLLPPVPICIVCKLATETNETRSLFSCAVTSCLHAVHQCCYVAGDNGPLEDGDAWRCDEHQRIYEEEIKKVCAVCKLHDFVLDVTAKKPTMKALSMMGQKVVCECTKLPDRVCSAANGDAFWHVGCLGSELQELVKGSSPLCFCHPECKSAEANFFFQDREHRDYYLNREEEKEKEATTTTTTTDATYRSCTVG